MCAQLTIGGIHRVFNADDVNSPIFQVLAITSIHSENHDRLFLKLSDGIFSSTHCVVGTQLNWIVENLKPYSKIRVNRYVCKNITESRKVFIILDLDVLQIGREDTGVIGIPRQYETSSQQGVSGNTTSNNSQQNSMETSTMESDQPVSVQIGVENNSIMGNLSQYEISHQGVSVNTTSNNSQVSKETPKEEFSQPGPSTAPQCSSLTVGSSGSTSEIYPISSLTPNLKRWVILARVIYKSDIILHKTKSGGEGKRFFIDLIDGSGEIRAKAFDKWCKKFYHDIKTNCVYYITQSELKGTDKLYYSPNKDFEIHFDYRTEVRLCKMKTNIPYRRFQFVSIDEIENIENGKFIDVIAICKKVDEISMTRMGKKKRDIQIVDQSGVEVQLTLWDKRADGFGDSQNSVIVVKGAQVKEYGRCLWVSSPSIVQINPDIEESYKLRRWYEEVGCNLQAENLSQMERPGEGMRNDLKMVGEVLALAENIENGSREYRFVKATIIHLNKNNCIYKACPSNGCNKKVTEMNNGVFFCERCKENYDSFNLKYVLKATIADGTDSILVTLFQDEAESLLGCTAVALEAMRERVEDAFYATLDFVLYRDYIFELMVKMDLYRGERNLNTIVKSVQPLNYRDYN
ncbi:UNVERIFIED_CONTAM: hypothetical protein RMT77_009784 [Armadillidium vulgare]